MATHSVKYINKLIENEVSKGNSPTKLILGYKTFPLLLADEKFLKDLSAGTKNQNDRFYKKLKIKLITEKHFCEVE